MTIHFGTRQWFRERIAAAAAVHACARCSLAAFSQKSGDVVVKHERIGLGLG